MSTFPDAAAPPRPGPRPPQVPRPRRFKSPRVIAALILREISASDSRTTLGFLWQVIEPAATVALLTLIFTMISRTPPLGTNYPLFYVTGVLPFQMFVAVSNKVSTAVRFSRPLLEFPAVSILDAIAARFILNVVIECAIFVLLVWLIVWFYDLRVLIDIPTVMLALALAAVLGLGIGTFNSVLFVAYPVYETAYVVLTRPLLLISGVLFQIEHAPEPLRTWLAWNPVAHPVGLMRSAFYAGAETAQLSIFFVLIVAMVAGSFGLVSLHRFYRDALER